MDRDALLRRVPEAGGAELVAGRLRRQLIDRCCRHLAIGQKARGVTKALDVRTERPITKAIDLRVVRHVVIKSNPGH